MKIGQVLVTGTAAAFFALPTFAAGDNERAAREMNRGVPGVDVDVNRGPGTGAREMNRGVPGVDIDVNRRQGPAARDRDRQGMGDRQAMQGGMHNEQVRDAQESLKRAGFDPGPIDGIMGPMTQEAIRDFQQSKGMQATGRLNQQTLAALDVNASASVGSDRKSRTGSASGDASSSAGAGRSGTFGSSRAHAQCDALQGEARQDCLKIRSTPSVTSGGAAVGGQQQQR